MYIPATISLLLLSFIPSSVASSEAKPKPPPKPCTIHSTATGSFFDLRPLQLALDGTKYQTATNESFHARGFDYPANFTMNFCGPVVEPLDDVAGIPSSKVANVAAFYNNHRGDIYRIGPQKDELIFRGKKLLINYTMGSPCPELDEDGIPIDSDVMESEAHTRRKSTLFSII